MKSVTGVDEPPILGGWTPRSIWTHLVRAEARSVHLIPAAVYRNASDNGRSPWPHGQRGLFGADERTGWARRWFEVLTGWISTDRRGWGRTSGKQRVRVQPRSKPSGRA